MGEGISEHIKDRDAKGLVDRDAGGYMARGIANSLG